MPAKTGPWACGVGRSLGVPEIPRRRLGMTFGSGPPLGAACLWERPASGGGLPLEAACLWSGLPSVGAELEPAPPLGPGLRRDDGMGDSMTQRRAGARSHQPMWRRPLPWYRILQHT